PGRRLLPLPPPLAPRARGAAGRVVRRRAERQLLPQPCRLGGPGAPARPPGGDRPAARHLRARHAAHEPVVPAPAAPVPAPSRRGIARGGGARALREGDARLLPRPRAARALGQLREPAPERPRARDPGAGRARRPARAAAALLPGTVLLAGQPGPDRVVVAL